jgi:hypothetical protein
VLYISLLELALDNTRPGPVYIDKEIKELMYKIEEILKFKTINNKLYYLIH